MYRRCGECVVDVLYCLGGTCVRGILVWVWGLALDFKGAWMALYHRLAMGVVTRLRCLVVRSYDSFLLTRLLNLRESRCEELFVTIDSL